MIMMLLSILYGLSLVLGIINFLQAARGNMCLHRVALSPSSDRRQGTHTIQGDSPSSRVEPRAL